MKTEILPAADKRLEQDAHLATLKALTCSKTATITAVVATAWTVLHDLWPVVDAPLIATVHQLRQSVRLLGEWIASLPVTASLLMMGGVVVLYAVALFAVSGNERRFQETLTEGGAAVTVAFIFLTTSWPRVAALAVVACWAAPFAVRFMQGANRQRHTRSRRYCRVG